VQDQLEQHAVGVRVDEPEGVDPDDAVLELHALAQAPADVARHRAQHLGEVGLGDLEGRVRQAVRQLAVVGQQQQPSVSASSRPDVEERSLRLATRSPTHGRPSGVVMA
jgi:hypothetical protein